MTGGWAEGDDGGNAPRVSPSPEQPAVLTSTFHWRDAAIERLGSEAFDVLVVGAGSTGSAIARDAALRGLRVALCDRGDFAAETSSHSSKLIHGGLRYLEHGDFHLVFEALAERRRLLEAAPHLCRPIEFVFPAFAGTEPSLRTLGLGVRLYDALALWRPPARSGRLSAHELYEQAPLLKTAGLAGALWYVDCQTDDARLVLETALDAETAGATVATYVEVEAPASSARPTQHLRTTAACDLQTGRTFSIRARAIVNAAGPFSDAFSQDAPRLRPTRGVHILVDADRLPTGGRGFVLRGPGDGRIVFVLPAGPRTLIGTTDTDWRAPDDGPRPPRPGDLIEADRDDVAYLLRVVEHAFPAAGLRPEDVISTFTGLRPLLSSGAATPSAASREHEIWVDSAGTLSVAGGKLTTMRSMAEEAVDKLIPLLRSRGLDREAKPCSTKVRPLPGGAPLEAASAALDAHELAPDLREHLLRTYGARVPKLLALAEEQPNGLERILPDLPYVDGEIEFAVRHDHAEEVDDVLRRRVPIFRMAVDQGLSIVDSVGARIAHELRWTPDRLHRSLRAYRERVAASRGWQGPPTSS